MLRTINEAQELDARALAENLGLDPSGAVYLTVATTGEILDAMSEEDYAEWVPLAWEADDQPGYEAWCLAEFGYRIVHGIDNL